MDDDEADRLHDELVAAFFHPPRIVAVGRRIASTESVTIVSHLELWPWRTVIAGSVARNGVERGHRRGREHADWLGRWSIGDDVGTDYRAEGGGSHGNGYCSDFQIRFAPAPTGGATLLRVTTPHGEVVEVRISSAAG